MYEKSVEKESPKTPGAGRVQWTVEPDGDVDLRYEWLSATVPVS